MNRNHSILTFANVAEWAKWLSDEAETSDGVWIALIKKGATGPTSLTYEEALDEALCYGFIDGPGYKRDENIYVRRFTPRRPNSVWSKRNVGYIERLENEGRMQARGKREVEKAKADGRWDKAYSQADMEPPADLMAAISKVPDAQAQWDILTKQNKFAICFRLMSLKTKAGREKRLEASVDMLARGETLHPQKRTREPLKMREPSKITNSKARRNAAIAQTSRSQSPLRRSRRLQRVSVQT